MHPGHQQLLLLNKWAYNSAKIDAAINCLKDTTFEKHLWHFLSEKYVYIFFISVWMSVTDNLAHWIRLIAHMSWIHIALHHETLAFLKPFKHIFYVFICLLLFVMSRWKFCFLAVSGKSHKNAHGNSSFGWVELNMTVFFLIPTKPYIFGRRDYYLNLIPLLSNYKNTNYFENIVFKSLIV